MDYFNKKATFDLPNETNLEFKGTWHFPKLISALKAERLMSKGGLGYLAYFISNQEGQVKLQDVLIVKDCEDLFLEDLPILFPDKEIEFSIDLVEGMQPISMTPYQMELTELKELKAQL